MGFHWSLSDSKSPGLLSIFDLNNAAVWMVSICPLISKSSGPFINALGIVTNAPIMIGITVTFLFLSCFFFFSSLAWSWYLSIFLFLLILLCGLLRLQNSLFGIFFFFFFFFFLLTITSSGRFIIIIITIWPLA